MWEQGGPTDAVAVTPLLSVLAQTLPAPMLDLDPRRALILGKELDRYFGGVGALRSKVPQIRQLLRGSQRVTWPQSCTTPSGVRS